MAQDTEITRLNFLENAATRALIDKRAGLKLEFGTIDALPAALGEYENMNNGFCIALTAQGMAQDDLDRACQSLSEAAIVQDIPLLITKSDLPYDARWFMAGDIPTLIDLARLNKIDCPFSDILYDDIITECDKTKS